MYIHIRAHTCVYAHIGFYFIDFKNRRFPTQNNIKLREAENLEKVQRGETIKQNRHVFKTTRTTTHGKKRKPYRRLARKSDDCPHASELYRGLRPFPGIGKLYKYANLYVCARVQMCMCFIYYLYVNLFKVYFPYIKF